MLEGLPRGLYDHVQQVRATARELAAPLDLDPALVDLAASAHDIARVVKGPRLLAEARRRGIRIDRVESALPVLLHGPVGAERLRRDLGVTEPQVLEAVHWHSTAAPGLGAHCPRGVPGGQAGPNQGFPLSVHGSGQGPCAARPGRRG